MAVIVAFASMSTHMPAVIDCSQMDAQQLMRLADTHPLWKFSLDGHMVGRHHTTYKMTQIPRRAGEKWTGEDVKRHVVALIGDGDRIHKEVFVDWFKSAAEGAIKEVTLIPVNFYAPYRVNRHGKHSHCWTCNQWAVSNARTSTMRLPTFGNRWRPNYTNTPMSSRYATNFDALRLLGARGSAPLLLFSFLERALALRSIWNAKVLG
jgi:hypothetical protein